MANLIRATPHSVIPGILTPQVQSADFKEYLAGMTKIGEEGDDYLYITSANAINTETFVGQQWGHNLAKNTYTLGQVQAPYYRIESYVEWNVQEQAKFEKLTSGVGLPAFLDKLAEQAINQKRHQAILYGFDSAIGADLQQGILSNSTIVTLPPDTNKNTTLTSYDVPQLLKFLIQCARQVMDATFNLTKPIVIAGSVRTINYLKSILVPLTEYANTGSVASIGGVYDAVAGGMLGVGKIQWVSDNLLMQDGADVLMFLAPGIMPDDNQGADSQNIVGKDMSITWNTFVDVIKGLVYYPNTPSLGWYGGKYTYKMTCGVNLRPETCITCPISYN